MWVVIEPLLGTSEVDVEKGKYSSSWKFCPVRVLLFESRVLHDLVCSLLYMYV